MSESPWLFVGLGNPGSQYVRNRHNIGFMAMDAIAEKFGFSGFKSKYKGELADGTINGQKVLLLKPQTFMNLSGQSVQPVMAFYKIPLNRIVVFHDELDLSPGKLRVKTGGGAGGHNGLKSIDGLIGQNYHRVRLGIGHPGDRDRVSGYVLSDFPSEEETMVETLVSSVAKNASLLVKNDTNGFMNRVSRDMQPPKPEKEKKKEQKDGI